MKKRMILLLLSAAIAMATVSHALENDPLGLSKANTEILVVVGASGTDEYGKDFQSWVEDWKKVARSSGTSLTTIGIEIGDTDDRQQIQTWLQARVGESVEPLWIILIGHGTYSAEVAKFNLRGPDVSADDFSQWLAPIHRPMVVINCASASGPFINRLSSTNRVIVTSTKSGNEQNYSHFGQYFAAAVTSPDSDLDHDDEVSVHEAFLRASGEVKRFYESEARIATEHALIDDNGDAKGTPSTMFRGVRAIASAKDGTELDGPRASRMTLTPSGMRLELSPATLKRRDQIESELDSLRKRKSELSETDYYGAIEPLMFELATIYHEAEVQSGEANP